MTLMSKKVVPLPPPQKKIEELNHVYRTHPSKPPSSPTDPFDMLPKFSSVPISSRQFIGAHYFLLMIPIKQI